MGGHSRDVPIPRAAPLFPFLASLLAGAAPGPIGQLARRADIQIRTLEVTKARSGVSVRVVVYTEHDAEARDAMLLILLPEGAGIQKLVSGCTASASAVSSPRATVTCELGSIADRGIHEVLVAITPPRSSTPSRLGVFAWSATPDPRPGNNYAERILPSSPR
jgi:hypothetical protein